MLLDRKLPRMASVEHTGDNIQPFALIPSQIDDVSAWLPPANPLGKHCFDPYILLPGNGVSPKSAFGLMTPAAWRHASGVLFCPPAASVGRRVPLHAHE